jgi:lipoate-protein ligase A
MEASHMTCWRLLKLETHNAYMNMAIDEAILDARINGIVPNTVRFYRWNPSAVSIGKFQNIENEVYLENCLKHGVDVVRRITGGGTVYHDVEGEITYSVVASKDD